MGKASDLRAYWQLAFFILPLVIIGIIALPIVKMAHDVELKFFLISLVFIAFIIKSEIDKRRFPSLTLFFSHVQSIMLAIMFMIILAGLAFLFDYQFAKWFGKNNIYLPVTIGFLYACVTFLIIWRNPFSARYVPWILILPFLVSTLVGDFNKSYLVLWLLVAVFSALGYYAGMKRAGNHKRIF